jgi:hypothetical protein
MFTVIPVFKPYLGPDEMQASVQALELGWLGIGSYAARFEAALAEFLELGDDRYLAAVSTGHAALHLGLMLAGVGSGGQGHHPGVQQCLRFSGHSRVRRAAGVLRYRPDNPVHRS